MRRRPRPDQSSGERRAQAAIWADRCDRDLADIFATQDKVIGKIVEVLVGRPIATGLKQRYQPANLEAYQIASCS